MGFGPTTSTLARLRSTPELYPHHLRCVILISHNFYFASTIFIFFSYFVANTSVIMEISIKNAHFFSIFMSCFLNFINVI